MAEAVKVVVRCRPMNARELGLKCDPVIKMDSATGLCELKKPKSMASSGPPKRFTFDGVYFTESNSGQIYEDVGFPLVDSVLQG